MDKVGEIKVVIAGKEEFDKDMPVKGTLVFEFPNGKKTTHDVIGIEDLEWYKSLA